MVIDHLLQSRVPHLRVVVADGGCKQRNQSTERPVHSTFFYIQLYLPWLNYTRSNKLQFQFHTSEQMRIELLQLLALFKQLLVVLGRALGKLGPAVFDDVLVLCLQKDDDGVILRVVQFVHIVGRNVKQAVLPLWERERRMLKWELHLIQIQIYLCLAQWNF